MSQEYILTREDFEKSLNEELRFLRKSSDDFDTGDYAEAKRIATSLVKILHTSGKQQTSLVDRLGLNMLFYNSAFREFDESSDKTVVFTRQSPCPLIWRAIDSPKPCYPVLDGTENTSTWEPFDTWWNNVVMTDSLGNQLSRKELVTVIRDKEGAHVDAKLSQKFSAMQKYNSIQEYALTSDGDWVGIRDMAYIAVRQIGHEVLRTFIKDYRKSTKELATGPGFFTTGGFQLLLQKPLTSTSSESSTKKKIGRNEPCYCGSGRKYKYCHGKFN